jgi:hypothetical protein
MKNLLLVVALVMATRATAFAQQRPLLTEDPETVGTGLILLEAGFDHQKRVFYPVSGLTGDLLRFPTLGVSFGVGSIAEIQIDGVPYQRLNVTGRESAPLASLLDFEGDRTTDVDDIVIGTKVRIVPEAAGRPAIALRFATKLPNAGNESGLGTDTTDFHFGVLVGKTVQSVRFVANAGLGILADPIEGHEQNDVLTYGLSLARAVAEGVELVGELNGRAGFNPVDEIPPGTENRGALRFGARLTKGTVRLDGGAIIGLTSRDPSFGFTAGLTWVFRGFSTP